jgi:hypothetical protein
MAVSVAGILSDLYIGANACAITLSQGVIAANWALESGYPNPTHGSQDGARHVYWQALLTISYNAWIAKLWGDAHEVGAIDEGMDQYNNRLGRAIGQGVRDGKIADMEAAVRKVVDTCQIRIIKLTGDPCAAK